MGDDKKYNYDGGVIGEKIITQKIYSNQSSHKTISWYIQDNHTIVRHHTNINQSQQKKSEKTKKSDTKNPNIFNTPPQIYKNFSEKKIKFPPKNSDSQTLHIGLHTPNKKISTIPSFSIHRYAQHYTKFTQHLPKICNKKGKKCNKRSNLLNTKNGVDLTYTCMVCYMPQNIPILH